MVFGTFQILLLEKIYKSTKIKQTKLVMSEIYSKIDHAKVTDLQNPSSNLAKEIEVIIKDAEIELFILKKEPVKNILPSESVEVDYLSIYPNNDISDFYQKVINKEQLTQVYNTVIDIGNPMFVVINQDDNSIFKLPISSDSTIVKDNDFLYCQRLELSDTSRTYMIVIKARITPVQPAVDTLKTQLLYITLIIILLSVLLALIMSREIAKPIMDINKEAKKLANGEYNLMFNGTGYLEIRELNNTLNYAVEELKKTETLNRELLANVSHDLKTPLTLISGYAEMMKDFPNEIRDENIQIIIDESNRLKELVSDLLELSRINARTEPLNLTVFSITDCVQMVVNRQQKFIGHNDFVINFSKDTNVSIEADQHKIEQVLYNFITNAINYSDKTKRIDVIQETTTDYVIIKIRDYGIGIKEEDIDYVWQRYYRVDKGHKRASQGTGLGLSIVKSILDYHNFTYGVESVYQKGSTFWLKMPIKK